MYGMKKTNIKKKPAKGKKQYKGFAKLPESVQRKINNVRESLNKENEAWQRIAMFLGWSKWNLGIKDKKKMKKKKKKKGRRSYGRI